MCAIFRTLSNRLAELRILTGEYETAEKLLEESIRIYKDFSQRESEIYRENIAETYLLQSVLKLKQAEFTGAEKTCKDALDIYRILQQNSDAFCGEYMLCTGVYGLILESGKSDVERGKQLQAESLKWAENNPDHASAEKLRDLLRREEQ